MFRFILFIMVSVQCLIAQPVSVSHGSVVRLTDFRSGHVVPRSVDIWLPEGYSASHQYAVVYMHDGQMLFDPSTTWNKQAWEADETAGKLAADPKLKKFIIVGIHSIAKYRHSDYFPQKPFESLPAAVQDSLANLNRNEGNPLFGSKVNSDNYLRFIVEELKPYIDKNFHVAADRDNTFIAGSSMGGLISLYAVCEYPEIFGGAACISTHWPGTFTAENNPIPEAFFNYMRSNLPKPDTHRIYFDHGDQTLDALYPPLQGEADKIMVKKGFDHSNWSTRFFPGADHSEAAWRARLEIPLRFLLTAQ